MAQAKALVSMGSDAEERRVGGAGAVNAHCRLLWNNSAGPASERVSYLKPSPNVFRGMITPRIALTYDCEALSSG